MAKDEKKGGLFSRFKKDAASDQVASGIPASTPPAAPKQSSSIVTKPESKSSLVSPAQPKAAVTPKSAAAPASSDSIDTIEAFNVYCSSLVEIGTSQLKVLEMALHMLSNSLNKIINGPTTGK
jgi:hypothetical protein